MLRRFAVPFAVLLAASACTPKSEAPATAAAETVDTAMVKAAGDSLRTHFIARQLAGDASGLAGLFSEQGGVDLYGAPRVRGRAALEGFFKADLGARTYTLAEITPVSFQARSNMDGSEVGTYHDMHDAKGKKDHEWGRYLVAYAKGADGQWRLDYLIAFPDSVKVAK